MRYEHRQNAPWYILIIVVSAVVLGSAWLLRSNPGAVAASVVAAMVLLYAAFSMKYMIVRDEGDHLAVRYGPLPILRRWIPYSEITAVEPGRVSLLDGWGVHYFPGRGWTYTIWGFDYVKVRLGRKTVRIGTDDVHGLAEFLKSKLAEGQEGGGGG